MRRWLALTLTFLCLSGGTSAAKGGQAWVEFGQWRFVWDGGMPDK
jgi:hypothetical protein